MPCQGNKAAALHAAAVGYICLHAVWKPASSSHAFPFERWPTPAYDGVLLPRFVLPFAVRPDAAQVGGHARGPAGGGGAAARGGGGRQPCRRGGRHEEGIARTSGNSEATGACDCVVPCVVGRAVALPASLDTLVSRKGQDLLMSSVRRRILLRPSARFLVRSAASRRCTGRPTRVAWRWSGRCWGRAPTWGHGHRCADTTAPGFRHAMHLPLSYVARVATSLDTCAVDLIMMSLQSAQADAPPAGTVSYTSTAGPGHNSCSLCLIHVWTGSNGIPLLLFGSRFIV